MTAAGGQAPLKDLVESFTEPDDPNNFKDGMTADEVTDAVVDHILSVARGEAVEILRPLVDDLVRWGYIRVGS